ASKPSRVRWATWPPGTHTPKTPQASRGESWVTVSSSGGTDAIVSRRGLIPAVRPSRRGRPSRPSAHGAASEPGPAEPRSGQPGRAGAGHDIEGLGQGAPP